jgi:TolB-like protein
VPNLFVAAVAAAAVALVPAAPHAAEGSSRKQVKVAVMEIRALGTDAHMSDLLSEVALTEVGSMDRIDVIGRSDIESMLGFEKQKKILGCTEEASCLAEIGGALGVEYVVVGSLGRIGGLYRLDMKIVETAKGRVRGRTGESVEGKEETLVVAVQRAIHRLLDPLVRPAGAEPPPPFLATPVTPAAPAATPVVPPKTLKQEPPAKAGSSRKTWGYVIGAVGIAAIAGGAGAGISAKSAYDDEKAAAASGDLATFESSRDTAKSRALIADVLYGVGAIGLGVGAYLVFVGPSGTSTQVALSPMPSGALVVLSGGF